MNIFFFEQEVIRRIAEAEKERKNHITNICSVNDDLVKYYLKDFYDILTQYYSQGKYKEELQIYNERILGHSYEEIEGDKELEMYEDEISPIFDEIYEEDSEVQKEMCDLKYDFTSLSEVEKEYIMIS